MNGIQMQTAKQREAVLAVLTNLKEGKISDAVAYFAEKFQFNDWGLGLDFADKERLTTFFEKARELYPDSSLQVERILVSGDHVITKWVVHDVLIEPFFGGLSRKVPISIHGASVIRIENGEIKEWSDYYDGLTARRNSLAMHFEEWAEL